MHTRHKPSDANYTHGPSSERKRIGGPNSLFFAVNMQSASGVGDCHFRHDFNREATLYPWAVTAPGPAGRPLDDEPAAGRPDSPVRTAAFFDLDKTVIAKSSTLAFSKPFANQGLMNRRAVLKASYAQFFFLMPGADHDQMDRMRSYVTSMCTGWDVEQVRAIVKETLHDIVDPLVFAEAAELIADHRLCGRDVVVVSASGEEIVGPIARALGATHAMATRRAVQDGRYTGEIEFYCHGDEKASAIRELAALEGYALEHCYAYSDSVADLPMLAAVGHPAVVNPDRVLRKEAAARGWPVLSFSRPVPLRERIPSPSGAAVATTVAVGLSTLGAGVVSYALSSAALRRLRLRRRRNDADWYLM